MTMLKLCLRMKRYGRKKAFTVLCGNLLSHNGNYVLVRESINPNKEVVLRSRS